MEDVFTTIVDYSWSGLLLFITVIYTGSWLLFALVWHLLVFLHDKFGRIASKIMNTTSNQFFRFSARGVCGWYQQLQLQSPLQHGAAADHRLRVSSSGRPVCGCDPGPGSPDCAGHAGGRGAGGDILRQGGQTRQESEDCDLLQECCHHNQVNTGAVVTGQGFMKIFQRWGEVSDLAGG